MAGESVLRKESEANRMEAEHPTRDEGEEEEEEENEEGDDDGGPSPHKPNDSKKARRKKKKKKKRPTRVSRKNGEDGWKDANDVEVEFDYVSAPAPNADDPSFGEFAKVFAHFSSAEQLCGKQTTDAIEEETTQKPNERKEEEEEERMSSDEEKEPKRLSRKQRRKMNRLTIAELKQLVDRPDVVEMHDANSADPKLLIHLKSCRNTVTVPRHWCQKRRYLQNKKGVEKLPFLLPHFIEATGIAKIRAAVQEKEEKQRMKQKQRERMQPKMGKIDIDYQILHDAFFRYQTKPKMGIHGDQYYEFKENEVQMKKITPGMLSFDLKSVLGMPEGAPPPWLINMQRYGPPPSYPNLKIPGLNAPIPTGAQYGYHPGGWGKPPVDEYGRPLYGDVFGAAAVPDEPSALIDRKLWGEMEEEEYSSEEEQETAEAPEKPEEEEEEEKEEEQREIVDLEGGIASVTTTGGIETPDVLDVRKARKAEEEGPKQPLYTVLEQQAAGAGGGLFGSSYKYVVPPEGEAPAKKAKGDTLDLLKTQKMANVDVALDPSELERVDDEMLRHKYDEKVKVEKERDAKEREGVSALVEETLQKKHKRKSGAVKSDSKSKKYKEFKF